MPESSDKPKVKTSSTGVRSISPKEILRSKEGQAAIRRTGEVSRMRRRTEAGPVRTKSKRETRPR